MKKIKIMLTVVVVFATVGAALAIKSKRSNVFCTAAVKADGTCGDGTASNPYQLCLTAPITGKITASGGALRCTTVLTPQSDCGTNQNRIECPTLARTTATEP